MTEAFQTKYRPTKLEEVIGHASVIKSIRSSMEKNASRVYLFTGPSGLGKTTFARIIAAEAGCDPTDLMEVDAATNTGIDDMRAITAPLMYRPLGSGRVKAIIIDEAHGLSKQAWNSLLKVLEEPPSWVYWFLCSTEPAKIPAAIRTRASSYALKPLDSKALAKLYDRVIEAEKLDIPEEVDSIIIREAHGSPRQLLSNIAVCSAAKSREEAAELLRTVGESSQAIALVRALLKGVDWETVREWLTEVGETSPETIRHVIRAYTTKVLLSTKSRADTLRALSILEAVDTPFNPQDGITPLALALARLTIRD